MHGEYEQHRGEGNEDAGLDALEEPEPVGRLEELPVVGAGLEAVSLPQPSRPDVNTGAGYQPARPLPACEEVVRRVRGRAAGCGVGTRRGRRTWRR